MIGGPSIAAGSCTTATVACVAIKYTEETYYVPATCCVVQL
jgi:hypothetical protein